MSAATAVIKGLIMCLECGGSEATSSVYPQISNISTEIEPSLGFLEFFLKLRKVIESKTRLTKCPSHWF